MNSTSCVNLFGNRMLVWLAFLGAAALPVVAASQVQTNLVQVVPRSVFLQPSNPKEGCDPFYPNSVRPYESAVVPNNGPATDLSSVIIKGISGSPDHRLVIINNVTFAVGDEAEVFTSQGRLRIRCLIITDDSAVIEAAGQRQILRYNSR
jgi:hypothetical protein